MSFMLLSNQSIFSIYDLIHWHVAMRFAGGYFGTGQSAGQIASYLLAVKDQSKAEVVPSKFLSICKCGPGLSEDEEIDLLLELAPYLMKNTKLNMPPSNSGYMVTGSRYERPDFWVSQPQQSVVLQVSAEKRVYPSFTFKAGHTFRFSRAVRVRYDKNWMDFLSIQEFEEMIAAAKPHGNSIVGKSKSLPGPNKKKKYGRTSSGTLIPVSLQGSDHSHVVQKSSQFSNLVFCCKSMRTEMMEDWTVRIIEADGKISLNLERCVTHVISAQAKGLQYKAAVASGRDVISMDWLDECLDSSKLLPITFRHYLHLSDATKEKQKDEVDCYGDSYFESLIPEDLSKIFQNMENVDGQNVDTDTILKVEKKYFGPWKWSIFRGITLYLLPPIHSTNVDSQTIAQLTLQRLGLEASMYGVDVVQVLNETVTHAISFAPSFTTVSFKSIVRSIQASDQQQVLLCEIVNVVWHLWLEESIQQKSILPVAPYNLRSEIVLRNSIVNRKAGSITTKEEIPALCSQTKRQRVCETPTSSTPSSTVIQSSQKQAHSDSQELSPRDSLDDFLQILLPSIDSC